MTVLLRAAHADDAAGLTALVNSAYRGEGSRRGWTTEADLLDGTRVSESTVRGLLGEPGCIVLVAELAGRLAGCVELRREGERLYLGMLTVDPALQGQGIGALLMDAAEDHARSLGLRRVVMTVISVRHELIAWYRRRGFHPTGEARPFGFPDESFGIPRRPLEFVVLEKALN